MAEPADQGSVAEVTRLLRAVGTGDSQASAELLPLVYEQLRALATKRMRQERPDQTLQATALVHEAYLRLVDQTAMQHWEGRWHFFAAAAEAMRRILIDRARRKRAARHGGDQPCDGAWRQLGDDSWYRDEHQPAHQQIDEHTDARVVPAADEDHADSADDAE